MLGAAFNTVDITAFYANFAQQNYSNFLSLITLDAKIAVNPQLKFIMETHRLFSPAVGLELSARYNKLNYYNRGKRLGKIDVGSASADLYTYRRLDEVIGIGFGLKQSYFNIDGYSQVSTELLETNFSGFTTSTYGYLAIDSRDDAYIPNKGFYMKSRFSVIADKGNFSDFIPIFDFTLIRLQHWVIGCRCWEIYIIDLYLMKTTTLHLTLTMHQILIAHSLTLISPF